MGQSVERSKVGLSPTLEISPRAPVGSGVLANRLFASIANQWGFNPESLVSLPRVSIFQSPEPVSRK